MNIPFAAIDILLLLRKEVAGLKAYDREISEGWSGK
jgi:hypothetical protein